MSTGGNANQYRIRLFTWLADQDYGTSTAGQPEGLEEWLNEMAKEGFFLHSLTDAQVTNGRMITGP